MFGTKRLDGNGACDLLFKLAPLIAITVSVWIAMISGLERASLWVPTVDAGN